MPKRSFEDLVELMKTLRGPNGCPWDRKQSLPDLKPFVIEEAYEVVDAIDRDDRDALREEIGDFLLEAGFIAEITRAEGSFDTPSPRFTTSSCAGIRMSSPTRSRMTRSRCWSTGKS